MNAKKRLTLVRTTPPWQKIADLSISRKCFCAQKHLREILNFLKMDKGFTKQKIFEIMRPDQKQDGLALLDLSAD